MREMMAVSAAELLALPGDSIEIGGYFYEITARMSELAELARRILIADGGSVRLLILDYDGAARVLPKFGGLVYPALLGDTDPMFNYFIESDNVNVNSVRETDYAVIFGGGDKRAMFLNSLRTGDPDSKILKNLDAAQSLPQLSREMGKTMFFNPLVLNDSLHRMMAGIDFGGMDRPGPFGGVRYETDGQNLWGGVSFGHSGADFSVSSGFYMGEANEDDKYKTGRALVYGAGVSAYYKHFGIGVKTLWADWDNIAVMTPAGGLKDSAKSRLFHAFLDFSPAFDRLRPVLRLNYVESEIAVESDEYLYLSYGLHAYVSDRHVGVSERYGFYVSRDFYKTDFGLTAGWRFSEDDAAVVVKLGLSNLSVEIRAGF
jgi:hypothetical protein